MGCPSESLVLLEGLVVRAATVFVLNKLSPTSYLLSLEASIFFSSTSYLTWAVNAMLAR